MVRVMSDVAASTSYQAPPPKAARFDPSQGFDSFGSLVDSNLPPERPSAPAQAAPQRPSNRMTTDRSAPRDAAPDQSGPSNRAEPRDPAGPSDSSATAASNPSETRADKASPGDGKSGDVKSGDGNSGETKSSDKSAKDSADADASATDATTVVQPNVPALTIQDPIAAVIPVTIAPADAPTVAQTPEGSAKPLAIAAAALAVAAATTRGSAASAGAETTSATTVDTETATGITPVTGGQGLEQAATISVPVKPATAAPARTPVPLAAVVTEQTDVTDTADIALAAAVSEPQTIGGGKTASAKVTPQAQIKSQLASDGSTSPDVSKTVAPPTELGLNVAPAQPAAGARFDAALAAAGAAKPEASSGTATTTDAVSSRDHGSAGNQAPASPVTVDATGPIPATFQPQVSPAPSTLSETTLTATAATGAPVPLSGLAVEIAASARSGKTRFDVRLDPADLGRIDVRIDVDRNGQVISHLRVEKPETLTMLQQDAAQLRQALDDAGLKTGHGGLQFSLRDQSSSGQNNGNQSGGNAQRLVVSEDDTVPVAVAGRSYGRMSNSNGGVDIRV